LLNTPWLLYSDDYVLWWHFEIVSNSAFISPVPLDALEHYRLIHGSDIRVILPEGGTVPVIKIFEYIE